MLVFAACGLSSLRANLHNNRNINAPGCTQMHERQLILTGFPPTGRQDSADFSSSLQASLPRKVTELAWEPSTLPMLLLLLLDNTACWKLQGLALNWGERSMVQAADG